LLNKYKLLEITQFKAEKPLELTFEIGVEGVEICLPQEEDKSTVLTSIFTKENQKWFKNIKSTTYTLAPNNYT
jgi:hypothetical protein